MKSPRKQNPRAADLDDALMSEGDTPWAEAGVSIADLEAAGFFARCTPEHHRKAAAYFARIAAIQGERPGPVQGDLFR